MPAIAVPTSASERALLTRAVGQFRSLLGDAILRASVEVTPTMRSHDPGFDALLRTGKTRFALEVKTSTGTGPVLAAATRLSRITEALRPRGHIPLLAVPYMGNVGRGICRQHGVSWLDLAGNADITAPGLRISIEGKPNPNPRRGRPPSVFAPKSSRIVRWLLINSGKHVTQRELADHTGLDEGFTSRIVASLLSQGFIHRGTDAVVRAADPTALLDAWRAEYDFSRHTILRGHVPARQAGDTAGRLSAELRDRHGSKFALTGLAAAWQYSTVAAYRLTTAYLRYPPAQAFLDRLSFREAAEGANLWLVYPNDPGVFDGQRTADDLAFVHPIQAYLDLKGHPERSDEAAAELRTYIKHMFAEAKHAS
jgi:hypothetical protein